MKTVPVESLESMQAYVDARWPQPEFEKPKLCGLCKEVELDDPEDESCEKCQRDEL